MKARIATLVPCVLFAFWGGAMGATRYVDDSVSTSGDGTSWQTAFRTIQQGIDNASDGDTVLVAEGTYIENIHFNGKNILLTSTDPLDPSVVAGTIIDGGGWGPVVSFFGSEDEACALSGLTIRNGESRDGGGICGGDLYNRARATIENNAIVNNSAWYHEGGGGLAYCDGIIRNNHISGNSAKKFGGGLYSCNGLISNNTICGNSVSGLGGGGLCYCRGMIEGNRISENSTDGCGGGIYDCDGIIVNNLIYGNSARVGGGMYSCSGAVQNNTIYANSATERGAGLLSCRGTILNCIVWGNNGREETQLDDCSKPLYSCIQDWVEGGVGNIWLYPHFVDLASGDFHLESWSPCIDGGDPQSPFADEPEPNGGRVDMGAYGNTREATPRSPDTDHDFLPDEWELEMFGNLAWSAEDDPDGDLVPNSEEIKRGYDPIGPPATWYVDGAVPSSGDGKLWETAFKTIQEGMDAASGGDTVVVAPGTYTENIRFKGKVTALRSTDQLDAGVVAGTVIDGNRSGSTVAFGGTECEGCLVAGFTIRNGGNLQGHEIWGAGVRGGTRDAHTHATIRNNIITGNSADDPLHIYCGGGLSWCDGLIEGNRITGNSAGSCGGGLYQCNGVIRNNVITANSAQNGGGLAECDGVIVGNVVSDNSSSGDGGGLYRCNGSIHNNMITRNSSKGGSGSAPGGGGLALCQGLIQANTVSDNTASNGGGLYRCDHVISNNLITGNEASRGGGLAHCDGAIEENLISRNTGGYVYGAGLYDCDGTIRRNRIVRNKVGLEECDGTIQNNIICGNYSEKGGGALVYCDGIIQNNTITGNSGAVAGLYYCSATVLNCIIWGNRSHSGSQVYLSAAPAYSCVQDWLGGGEGNTSRDPLFVDPDGPDHKPETYDDNDYRLLPDSPCIDAGFKSPDLAEFDIAGMHRIMFGGRSLTVDMGAYEFYINKLEPVQGTNEAVFTWSSLADKTYSIFYTDDLLNWHLAIGKFVSFGGTTTCYTDDGSQTGSPPGLVPRRFYRTLENP